MTKKAFGDRFLYFPCRLDRAEFAGAFKIPPTELRKLCRLAVQKKRPFEVDKDQS